MKLNIILACLLFFGAVPAYSEQMMIQPEADPVLTEVSMLQNEWARIKYQIPEEKEKLQAIHVLEGQASQTTSRYPSRAEPKIWEAIILSTEAGIIKGMSALPKVKQAKALLEQAEKIDTNALDGSIHTSLGSLYYQVPGWPIAFGDDKLAEQHLKMALQINPTGIDQNYFYGDFLLQDGRKEEARTYLERALQAPSRPGRELADAGRLQEIRAALANLSKSGNTGPQKTNP